MDDYLKELSEIPWVNVVESNKAWDEYYLGTGNSDRRWRIVNATFAVGLSRMEKDGVDYHFVSDTQFDEYIRNDEFVEWASVHGHRYGTLKSEVLDVLKMDGTIILDTDTVGAFSIKKQFSDAVLVFIAPPSPEELALRLRNRKTETPERIQKRLEAVPFEMEKMIYFDYVVVNDILDDTVAKVVTIIQAEKMKSLRVTTALTQWRNYLDKQSSGNVTEQTG